VISPIGVFVTEFESSKTVPKVMSTTSRPALINYLLILRKFKDIVLSTDVTEYMECNEMAT